jgi:uridine kinase
MEAVQPVQTEPAVLPFAYGHCPEDVALLAKHSFLAHIGPQDLGAFLDLLDQVALPAGTVVFRQGDEGEHMYFVLEGQGHVRRGAIDVARIGPGDHFGETAILGHRARSASVQTDSVMRVARLSRSGFASLGANHPRAALHFMEALAANLAATMTALRDDVGLLARQRSLPRRSVVNVAIGGRRMDVGTGTLIGTLLPRSVDDALVVAATVDRRAVSLDSPLTADAAVEALTTASWEGRRIFRRSAVLLVLEAARRAVPSVRLTVGPRIARRQLIFASPFLAPSDLSAIQQQLDMLVDRAEPLREELWAIEEAHVRFVEQGWLDAAALLPSYRSETVALLACGGTFALAFGPVFPTAGVGRITVHEATGGLLVDFGPALDAGGSIASVTTMVAAPREPRMPAREMAHELAAWLEAMHVTSVGRFNESCVDGRASELVRVSEGFHEKNIGRVADAIAERRLRVVAIAGPSSSGKTTFIRRLKVQLEVNGIIPVHLSLDDYYVDREKTPRDATGEFDFESINALDLPLLRESIARLVAGEQIRVPHFDFLGGKSVRESGEAISLASGNVLLVEGLHALNPLVSGSLPKDTAFRVFVHPATALSLDRLSAVLPDDVRLLRRIVRDRHGRGYTARDTIARWPSVRRGEEHYVFPFAAEADFIFDTSLVYEIAVLRVFAERYLLEVPKDDPAFVTAHRLRQLIDRFVPIYSDHVPRTSILREFIGGGFDVP